MLSVFKGVAHPDYCDVMDHMNIRHYMAMFDEASYQLLFEVFGWTQNDAIDKDIGFADVRHVIEYQAEISAGELLEIKGSLLKIGTKSVTLRYEMINRAKDEIASTLECTCVSFDTKERKAIPLSDQIRTQAEKHLVASAG
jgi:acyl-CoA thioester hydrolase